MRHGEEEPQQSVKRRGVSPDLHPDEPGGFLQLFVNYGAPALVLLWELEPGRRAELLTKWCKWARTEAWAREEARALLYQLVLRDETPPAQLCEVLRFPALRPTCGSRKKRGSDHRLEYIVKALEDERYTKLEVNQIFSESRADGRNAYHRTTLGKRLDRTTEAAEEENVSQGTVRRRSNHPGDGAPNPITSRAGSYSTDPLAIIQELLNTHEGRALELLWDYEPEKHPTFIKKWSERASCEGMMWDAVRRFVDDKIRRGQRPQKRLVLAASRPRPCSTRDPLRFERDMLWHAIVVTATRMGQRDAKARLLGEVCKSHVISNSTFDAALLRGNKYVYDSPCVSAVSQSGNHEHFSARAARPTVALPRDRSELPVGLIFRLKDWSEDFMGTPALQFFKDLGAEAPRYANRPWVVCGVPTLGCFEDIGPDARLWIRWSGDRYVDGKNTWLEFATTSENDADGATPKPIARSSSLDSRVAWKWHAIIGIQAVVNVVFVTHPKRNGGRVRWRHFFAYIEDPYYLATIVFRDGIESVTSGQAGPRMGPFRELDEMS